MKPKVSIIVPTYNVERYLEECLNSIVGQTFKDIEIIIVDDESTDSTVDIIRRYMAEDDRIKLIQKKHSNAGDSRNIGIENAKGEYLVFWDGDDFFDKTALKRLYDKCIDDNADICLCDGHNYDDALKRVKGTTKKINAQWIPEKMPFSRKDIPDYILYITAITPWNKMIRKSFIEENNIRFQSFPKINDAYFSIIALCLAEKITVVRKPLVYYRINAVTSTTLDNAISGMYIFKAFESARDTLVERGIYEELKYGFINKALVSYIYNLKNQLEACNLQNYREMYDYIKECALEKLGYEGQGDDFFFESEKADLYKMIKSDSYDAYMFTQYKKLRDVHMKVVNKYESSLEYRLGIVPAKIIHKIKKIIGKSKK